MGILEICYWWQKMETRKAADGKNLFPETHMQSYRCTGIKTNNAGDVTDFLTSPLPFVTDRSRRLPTLGVNTTLTSVLEINNIYEL